MTRNYDDVAVKDDLKALAEFIRTHYVPPPENELAQETSEMNASLCPVSISMVDPENVSDTAAKQSVKKTKKKSKRLSLAEKQTDLQAAPANECKKAKKPTFVMNAKESEEECQAIARHVFLQLRQLQPADRIDAVDDIQAALSRYSRKSLSARILYVSDSAEDSN